MATVAQSMTAEELFRMPADGMRHELVRGELITMPPAGFEHGTVTVNIAMPLHNHVKQHQQGIIVAAETGFVIERGPDTVRAPDIGFVSKERLSRIGIPKNFFPEAPDAAVEVLSPGDTVNEVDDKVQEWLTAGCLLVWVVNPRQKVVTVYRSNAKPIILTATDYLDGGDVIPGFRMLVGEIFVAG